MAQKKVPPTELVNLESSEFLYQPFYCEENIWQLVCRREFKILSSWVLMISNEKRTVAMAHMRRASQDEPLLVWDYHVIWVGLLHQQLFVIDLDTRLPVPFPLDAYLQYSFPQMLPQDFQPQFRLLDAHTYREQFSSDRSHMLTEANRYLAEPPSWPAIYNGKTNLLPQWLDFHHATAPGTTFGPAGLQAWAKALTGR